MSSRKPNKYFVTKTIPAIVFIGGILMAIFAYSINKKLEQQKMETVFTDRAQKISASVETWMDVNNEILESIESFYHASDFVSRGEFRDFVAGYLERHKNIWAINWIPRVKFNDRIRLEQDAVNDGLTGFQFTEEKNGETSRAGDREEYFPVFYRESLHANPSVMGLDMGSAPLRRSQMFEARDQNKILISGLVELKIKNEPQKGFVVFNPVYRKNSPVDTVEQRWENLQGFIQGAYTIKDIARNLLMDNEFKDINIIIIDTTNSDETQVIYNNFPEQTNISRLLNKSNKAIPYSHTLAIGGRNWKIIAYPTDNFYASMKSTYPVIVLLFGVILSLLISWTLKSNFEKTMEVERLVQERTKDLAEKERALNQSVLELKVSHKKLKETQDQLVHSKKLASIGQLAAGVAHEINNPLAFLCSNMEILEQYSSQMCTVLKNLRSLNGTSTLQPHDIEALFKGTNMAEVYYFTDDIKNVLKESNEGMDRIKSIVNQLRTFSRERDDDTVIPVRLDKLVENVLKIVKSDVLAKAELIKEYKLEQEIPCEAQKLEQVFLNILTNALHAIPEQGRIEIKTYLKDAFGCVEIRDSGIGILPEELDKVFDPFFTTKPVGIGTGLGLSISYDIVKKHGGNIEVESTPGKGTTFRVLLPVEELKPG